MSEPKANPFPGFFFIVGFLLLVGGVARIYWPASLILAGLLLLLLAFLGRPPA